MTERRKLKKEFWQLIALRNRLPQLIDMSEINGDNFYNHSQLEEVEKRIKEIREQLLQANTKEKNNE